MSMWPRKATLVEYAVVLTVFAAVNLLSSAYQKPVSNHNGMGWDGPKYCQVAEALSKGELPRAEAPYVYRVGTPFLASVIGRTDLVAGFKRANLAGNVVLVVLFMIWLRMHVTKPAVRVLLGVLLVTHWYGPVRYVYYSPVMVDNWSMVWMLAGLIGVERAAAGPSWRLIAGLSVIAFVGAFFRETTLIVPLALLFFVNPIGWDGGGSPFRARLSRMPPPACAVPLLCGLLGLGIVRFCAEPSAPFSQLETTLYWLYAKPLLSYVHAWFISYGLMVVIVIYFWRETVRFLVARQHLLVFLLACALCGWFGGSDTDRLVYWSMPVVYVLMGRALAGATLFARAPLLALVLAALQCLTQRLFLTTPDFPNPSCHASFLLLTPLCKNDYYFNLLSHEWGLRPVQLISLLQYAVLALLLLAWMDHRSRQTSG